MLAKRTEARNIVKIRIDDCYRNGDFAELAFTYAPVGLVVTENRVIRDCNPVFAEMFGYDVDELKNQEFSILYPTNEEFVNIRDRGIKQLQNTNTYWDERIMARKGLLTDPADAERVLRLPITMKEMVDIFQKSQPVTYPPQPASCD